MRYAFLVLVSAMFFSLCYSQEKGIPNWFLEELEGEIGSWVADNSEYKDDEPFDFFAITWAWGTSKKTLIGRLYGLKDGIASDPFWEYRKYWDAKEQRGIVIQFGIDGTVGVGRLFPQDSKDTELVQLFTRPDGTQYRSGHRNKYIDSHTREGTSYGIDANNVWTELRTYTWVKKKMTDIKKLPVINDLWDYNDPEKTAKLFMDLLPLAQETNASYHAELLTQIARTHSLQRQFDEAHALLKEVEESLTEKMVVPTIRYHLEKGRTFNSNNEKEAATIEFHKAYDLALQADEDFYTVDAAHMLGISDTPKNKLNWTLNALKIAEKSNDAAARKWRGSLYNNIGWTYHDQGDFEKALSNFEHALSCRTEQNDPHGIFIAKWTIGRTLRSLERLEEAITIQAGLLEEIKNGRAEADGYVYEELGECYLGLDHGELAKPYFKQAYLLLSTDTWLQANESERLNRLKELGQ